MSFGMGAHADLASIFTNQPTTARAAIPRRASVIYIQCHDLAIGDLSCYGQTNYQTPNIDRLAKEGVRFTDYFGGTDSASTISTLLNGKNAPLQPDEMNLAQRLQRSGYTTGLVGEWTFDRTPWTHGFQEFAGFFTDDEAQNYYPERIWRYPHKILNESNRVERLQLEHEMLYYNTGGKKGQYIPDLLFKVIDNYMRIHVPDAANRYRPFFLLVNLPAPRSAKLDAEHFPVPSDAPFTGEAWPQPAKNRAALISRIDNNIGKLLENATKYGMTNNLVIVFSSSTGPKPFANTNMNFMLPKSNFRNPTNAVPQNLPMIVHWPSKIPAGKVNDTRWTAADFAPTALELAYVPPITNFTGHSVLAAWENRPASKPEDSKP